MDQSTGNQKWSSEREVKSRSWLPGDPGSEWKSRAKPESGYAKKSEAKAFRARNQAKVRNFSLCPDTILQAGPRF